MGLALIGIDTELALDWRPSDTACQPLRLWNDIGLTSDWHQIGLRLSSDWHQICWIGNNLALYMQWVDTQVMRIGSPLAFDLHKSDNWHGIGARLISDWQWIDNGFRWIGIGLTLNWIWIVTGLYLYFQRNNSQATLGGNPLAAHVLHWDWHWQLEIGQSKPSQSCTNPAIPPQYELSWISMDWRGLTDWRWKYRKSAKLSVKLPWHHNSKLSIGLCILGLFVFLSFWSNVSGFFNLKSHYLQSQPSSKQTHTHWPELGVIQPGQPKSGLHYSLVDIISAVWSIYVGCMWDVHFSWCGIHVGFLRRWKHSTLHLKIQDSRL